MNRSLSRIPTVITGALSLLVIAPAQAHHAMGNQTPTTWFEGLLSGFAHPVIGVDHFAFLVVAALLSFAMRGNTRGLVPLAFVGATLAGTLVHLASADLPLVEMMVALSVIMGGVMALMFKPASGLLLGSLFALFGLFHGYAYGESIIGAEPTPLLAYLLGFATVQYVVIMGGIKILDLLAARSAGLQHTTSRFAACLATLTGGLFLAMNLT